MIDDMTDMRDTVHQIRDMVANFDDQFRPLRNYFYWEPHCFDIPVCWSMRSVFESIDGISLMSDDFQAIVPDMQRMADTAARNVKDATRKVQDAAAEATNKAKG